MSHAQEPTQPGVLTPAQVATLERILRAGFRLVTFERYARYIGIEKDGFVALLDPAGGGLRIFSQLGYRLEDGIAMLVERGRGKAFVWKGESVEATPELLRAYERIRSELANLLEACSPSH
jgi:hypothetical protein